MASARAKSEEAEDWALFASSILRSSHQSPVRPHETPVSLDVTASRQKDEAASSTSQGAKLKELFLQLEVLSNENEELARQLQHVQGEYGQRIRRAEAERDHARVELSARDAALARVKAEAERGATEARARAEAERRLMDVQALLVAERRDRATAITAAEAGAAGELRAKNQALEAALVTAQERLREAEERGRGLDAVTESLRENTRTIDREREHVATLGTQLEVARADAFHAKAEAERLENEVATLRLRLRGDQDQIFGASGPAHASGFRSHSPGGAASDLSTSVERAKSEVAEIRAVIEKRLAAVGGEDALRVSSISPLSSPNRSRNRSPNRSQYRDYSAEELRSLLRDRDDECADLADQIEALSARNRALRHTVEQGEIDADAAQHAFARTRTALEAEHAEELARARAEVRSPARREMERYEAELHELREKAEAGVAAVSRAEARRARAEDAATARDLELTRARDELEDARRRVAELADLNEGLTEQVVILSDALTDAGKPNPKQKGPAAKEQSRADATAVMELREEEHAAAIDRIHRVVAGVVDALAAGAEQAARAGDAERDQGQCMAAAATSLKALIASEGLSSDDGQKSSEIGVRAQRVLSAAEEARREIQELLRTTRGEGRDAVEALRHAVFTLDQHTAALAQFGEACMLELRLREAELRVERQVSLSLQRQAEDPGASAPLAAFADRLHARVRPSAMPASALLPPYGRRDGSDRAPSSEPPQDRSSEAPGENGRRHAGGAAGRWASDEGGPDEPSARRAGSREPSLPPGDARASVSRPPLPSGPSRGAEPPRAGARSMWSQPISHVPPPPIDLGAHRQRPPSMHAPASAPAPPARQDRSGRDGDSERRSDRVRDDERAPSPGCSGHSGCDSVLDDEDDFANGGLDVNRAAPARTDPRRVPSGTMGGREQDYQTRPPRSRDGSVRDGGGGGGGGGARVVGDKRAARDRAQLRRDAAEGEEVEMEPWRIRAYRDVTQKNKMAALVDGMVADLVARFSEQKLALPIYKVEDCCYLLRNRKMLLTVASGKLLVRKGGGWENILDFLARVRF